MLPKLKSRTTALFIAGAVITLLAIALWSSQRSFSSSRWRSADLTSQTRNDMVQDLINSRVLLGKRREEVVQLLGPVTETDKFKDWDMVYVLGPQDGYIDHEWLVLRTGPDAVISEQRVVYD